MEKENLYQSIEAYLDGELEGGVLATFEQELATDEVLAREVNLHRRLQQELGDGAKLDLRITLEAIADEFPDQDLDLDLDLTPKQNTPNGTGGAPGGGLPYWWWGLGFFLILGGTLWWYVRSLDTPTTVSNLQTDTVKDTTAADTPATTETTLEKVTEPAEPATENKPSTAPASQPSAFDINPALEKLVGQAADSFYSFTDDQLKYEVQGQRSYLNFNSKLTTSESVAEGLFLQLFTNQYPKGRVFREPLVLSPVNPDAPIAFAAKKEYFAVYSGETKLTPALYYGVVTLKGSTIPLWVGKVRVE